MLTVRYPKDLDVNFATLDSFLDTQKQIKSMKDTVIIMSQSQIDEFIRIWNACFADNMTYETCAFETAKITLDNNQLLC